MSNIEWTDDTWNVLAGCTPELKPDPDKSVCPDCYAARMAYRLEAMGMRGYSGLTKKTSRGNIEWTGAVNFITEALDRPLRRKKSTKWFVNSMSDLFHEAVSDEQIDKIFAVMALCPQHVFQVLTKRPGRMLEYCDKLTTRSGGLRLAAAIARAGAGADCQNNHYYDLITSLRDRGGDCLPLPNLHLGVTTENQAAAIARIPYLLKTPAAVRFLSVEPIREEIDLTTAFAEIDANGEPYGRRCNPDGSSAISWVIVGGQSGPGAPPTNIDWIRSIVQQCDEAGVPCFVKQLGASTDLRLKDRKGGDMSEWPEDLRVREFPKTMEVINA